MTFLWTKRNSTRYYIRNFLIFGCLQGQNAHSQVRSPVSVMIIVYLGTLKLREFRKTQLKIVINKFPINMRFFKEF